jgi:hypothetical protein
MKKRIIFLWILIGLILIFLISVYWFNIANKPDINQRVGICDDESEGSALMKCLKEVFKDISDVSVCESVKEEYRDYTCYKFVAINTNHPELCERTYATGYCYSEVAIALKNRSICDYAKGWYYYKDQKDNEKFKDYCVGLFDKAN